MRILAGLGNPGKSYENHRHNVGYWLIDELIAKYSLSEKEKPGYLYYPWQHDFGTTYLLRSKKYMNDSGLAVRQLANFYKIPVEDVWVAYDDMDFKPGSVRVKKQGGAGGHNGIKSVMAHLGPVFHRLRLGVDRPLSPDEVKQYVLTSPTAGDRREIESAVALVVDNIDLLLKGEYDRFTEKLHSET